jgi:acid phosphatase (class A)
MKNILLLLLMTASTAALAQQPAVPPAATRLGAGYLARTALPDAVSLLPPPPAAGSKALARDRKAQARAVALQGSARWQLAISDADLFTPSATSAFSCAAGFVIGPQQTPKLDGLLRKAASDLGLSTYPAKIKYQRARPFVDNGKPPCTPEYEAVLRKDGSYPSGHAAIGYGWGMILSEINPQQKKQLRARGAAFADSRRICNVHYKSDVEAGGIMARAVVQSLLADTAFQADLAAARSEARSAAPLAAECATQAAALKLR